MPFTSSQLQALANDAQQSAAQELAELFSRAGQAPDMGTRYRLERLTLSDLCESLLWRAALDFAESPACPAGPASAAKKFVRMHLRASLFSWLYGAARLPLEQKVLAACLTQAGMCSPGQSPTHS